MELKFANNAVSVLATTALLASTTLQVAVGEGTRFPSPGGGEGFHITVQNGSLYEIMLCTARTGDVLTVLRAQDGTAAQSWSSGSSVELRVNAGVLNSFLQKDIAVASYAPINGPIVLTADPVLSDHAARKGYVDTAVAAASATLQTQIDDRGARVGDGKDWWSPRLPAKWTWADGRALSRTTYAALFEALTTTMTGQPTAGNPTIPWQTGPSGAIGPGDFVTGPGVQNGAFIIGITSNSITLNIPCTGTAGPGQPYRIYHYGPGDFSTTFNIPDMRGRVALTRDTNGDVAAAGRITGVYPSNYYKLGLGGGDQWLQSHAHGVNDGGHNHGVNDVGHDHSNFVHLGPTGLGGGSAIGDAPHTATEQPTSRLGTNPALSNISINAATSNISIQASGAGGAQNLPPFVLCNYIIFTGV